MRLLFQAKIFRVDIHTQAHCQNITLVIGWMRDNANQDFVEMVQQLHFGLAEGVAQGVQQLVEVEWPKLSPYWRVIVEASKGNNQPDLTQAEAKTLVQGRNRATYECMLAYFETGEAEKDPRIFAKPSKTDGKYVPVRRENSCCHPYHRVPATIVHIVCAG